MFVISVKSNALINENEWQDVNITVYDLNDNGDLTTYGIRKRKNQDDYEDFDLTEKDSTDERNTLSSKLKKRKVQEETEDLNINVYNLEEDGNVSSHKMNDLDSKALLEEKGMLRYLKC